MDYHRAPIELGQQQIRIVGQSYWHGCQCVRPISSHIKAAAVAALACCIMNICPCQRVIVSLHEHGNLWGAVQLVVSRRLTNTAHEDIGCVKLYAKSNTHESIRGTIYDTVQQPMTTSPKQVRCGLLLSKAQYSSTRTYAHSLISSAGCGEGWS